MSMSIFKGELHIDRPITDLTGTVCQPGRYSVEEVETPDPSAGIMGSWVCLLPVTMTDAQAQFFADFFPERFTFDPDEVLPAFEDGRALLEEEREEEERQTREWEADQRCREQQEREENKQWERLKTVDCGCKLPAIVRDDGICTGCGAQVVFTDERPEAEL